MSSTPKLELRDLRKEYGDLVAVDDASVSISTGELIGLLGPSGSGKTTMLQMIAGLTDPTSGEIFLDGDPITHLPPEDRDIGLVFQNLAIFRKMTVGENLGYAARIEGKSEEEIDAAVERIAGIVGIKTAELDRGADDLNPNQQQRLALGRAIADEPDLMLMDEPMDNLDEEQSIDMRGEIKQLQNDLSQTMIYVTHDQEEAMSLASRIIVMDEGEIQQIGSPGELYFEPVNRFVASFIGSPSMNFFAGDAANGDLEFLDGSIPIGALGDRAAALADVAEITVGVRPEAFQLSADETMARFTARLQEKEPLGSKQLLHGEIAGEPFTLRTRQRPRIDRGDEFKVGVATADLYLFNAHTGEAIN
jgi:multiple sugar transport system ATP-binding protein